MTDRHGTTTIDRFVSPRIGDKERLISELHTEITRLREGERAADATIDRLRDELDDARSREVDQWSHYAETMAHAGTVALEARRSLATAQAEITRLAFEAVELRAVIDRLRARLDEVGEDAA